MQLTPADQQDLQAIRRWYEEPELHRLLSVDPPAAGEKIIYAMRDGPDLLGWCELFNIDWQQRTAEGGIAIPDPKGRGFALVAGLRFLQQAFEVFDLIRIRVLESNAHALKCAEAFGFLREGGETRDDGNVIVRMSIDKERFSDRHGHRLGKKVMHHGRKRTERPA